MDALEERVATIEARNASVETDKAWETSWTRMLLLAFFTYVVIGVFMWAIAIPRPWLSALVPSAGFVLSTLSMPYFKKAWLKRRK